MLVLSNKVREIVAPAICEKFICFLEQKQKGLSYKYYYKERLISYEKWIRIGSYCKSKGLTYYIRSFSNPEILDGLVDFPGYVESNNFGILKNIIFYKKGVRHREDGPARISYKNEIACKTHYIYDGLFHRIDGPARIDYDKFWYVRGKKIDENQFPIFENGKQVNDIVIDNAMKIKLMMFDREYFSYVMKITNG